MGSIRQSSQVNAVWKIWGRTFVLQPIMLPLEFLLSTWSILKWVITLLMTSMCSLPSLALGACSVAPSITEHELRTWVAMPCPHPASSVVWLLIPITLHRGKWEPSLFSCGHITLPSSSVGDFPPWVRPAPYFRKPRLETKVESSVTTDNSNH